MRAAGPAIVAGALAVIAMPRASDACTPLGNPVFTIDPASTDTTPPSVPTISNVRTWLHHNDRPGIGCPSTGHLDFDVQASDDLTPADRIGYEVTLPQPTPVAIYVGKPTDPVAETIYLRFPFDAPSFGVDLEVRALDLGGNAGPPAVFRAEYTQIIDDDDGGCASTRSGGWLLALGLALVATLRPRLARLRR